MNVLFALASLILFFLGFRAARVVAIASDALRLARNAVVLIADPGKSEDEKERAARSAALLLFGRFFAILGLTAASLIPSIFVVVLAIASGAADRAAMMNTLASPWLLAAAIALFAADYLVRR